MTLALRGYQQQALDAAVRAWAEGKVRLLIEMATGTGKTVLFGHLTKRVVKAGKRVMILAHRDELVRQAADKVFRITGIIPSIEKAEERSDEDGLLGKPPIVVSSIQTQYSGPEGRRRMTRFVPDDFGLVVADECHHSTADSWRAVIGHYLTNPGCLLLGVTATPDRNDDRNLGMLYEHIAFRYPIHTAIHDGYLVELVRRSVVLDGVVFSSIRTKRGPDGCRDFVESELEPVLMAEKVTHQIVAATIEISYGLPKGALKPLVALENEVERRDRLAALLAGKRHRRTLIFCVGVAQASLTADVLNRWLGELADSVDGTMATEERRENLRAFVNGTRPFLCNCMIATEGFDVPSVEAVVIARPTRSRSLLAQMVGRGTRPLAEVAERLGELPDAAARRALIAASAKPHAEILDFTDNSRCHDLATVFELMAPEADAEVVGRAEAIAEEQGVSVGDAIEEAEQQIEDEQAQARREAKQAQQEADAEEQLRMAAWRRRLVGVPEDYSVHDASIGGNVVDGGGGGATDKQIEFLVKLGVQRFTAQNFSKRQASAVIDSLKQKRWGKSSGRAA